MIPWTIALAILIIIDSIHTIFVGSESNPLILWVMSNFDLTLNTAMLMRIVYCLPLLYILNKTDWSRFTFFAYAGIYLVLSGAQFLL